MTDEKLINDLYYRQQRVKKAVSDAGAAGIILTSDVNIFYLTGLVFNGFYYLPVDDDPLLFVRRPEGLKGERIFSIRKPEQIPDILTSGGWKIPEKVFLETDVMPYNECMRLQNIFTFKQIENASRLMNRIRMIKTPYEIEQFRISASSHSAVYKQIKECYRTGMTDLQFQAEIERRMRLGGSIGVFRAAGDNCIFMGSILTGDNAAAPSPYDFALGGSGQTPFCPIGANGTQLHDGMAIMVDMVGNYTEYMTDMTRIFSIGKLPDEAYRAHEAALEIQATVEAEAKPDVPCAYIYNIALSIAEKAGFADLFMGSKQQAKFVGHGVGLEINELPVLTPRSNDILKPGIVFALEPKFVIPHVGAVGIENTFLVTNTGVEKLTLFPENICPL